jgi:hypothetical protein
MSPQTKRARSVGLAARGRAFVNEVIRIRRRDGFQIGGRFVEPAKVYPKSEAWGVDGFTMPHKDAAFAKLRQVSK